MSLVRDPDPFPVSGLVGPPTLADPQERLRQLLLAGARQKQRRSAAAGSTGSAPSRPRMAGAIVRPELELVVQTDSDGRVTGYGKSLAAFASVEIHAERVDAMKDEFNRMQPDAGCAHSAPQVLEHMASLKVPYETWKRAFDAGMRGALRWNPDCHCPTARVPLFGAVRGAGNRRRRF